MLCLWYRPVRSLWDQVDTFTATICCAALQLVSIVLLGKRNYGKDFFERWYFK